MTVTVDGSPHVHWIQTLIFLNVIVTTAFTGLSQQIAQFLHYAYNGAGSIHTDADTDAETGKSNQPVFRWKA